MVAVLEYHDRLPAGEYPGDLDGVLDCLGAGVEQRRPLLVLARGQPVERRADFDVALVGRDEEGGVGELAGLLRHPRDHAGIGVAGHGHTDP